MKTTEKINWLQKLQPIHSNTPIFAVRTEVALQKITLFKSVFPECHIYYAVKSFGDLPFVKVLKPHIDGFDIASFGEFKNVVRTDIKPKDILFSNPVKKPDHIAKTFTKGVNSYAFDSINELSKVAQNAPGANVYLRLKVYDHGSAFPLSSKFGAQLKQCVALMSSAQDLGLHPVGLTFHVGSQSESLRAWEVALEVCARAMKKLLRAGIKIDFINLGGGFPVEYVDAVTPLQTIVKTIRRSIKLHVPYQVKLVAEPGRFISAEAGLLMTTVIGREIRDGKDWLYTDVGTFNGLIEPLEMPNWKYPIFTNSKEKVVKSWNNYTITGPTCDPYDTYAHNVRLPSDIAVGDKLYIGNAGAYSVVYSSNFNGFEEPKIVYL